MLSQQTVYLPLIPTAERGVRPYYIDLGFTLTKGFDWSLDESGVPTRPYYSVGRQYSPTRVAAFALANWNVFLETHSAQHKANFFRQVDWFMQNARDRGAGVVWEYCFDWAGGLRDPWISCMAQGEGISVLCRAYELTRNDEYLDTARRAVHVFQQGIEEGGVRGEYPDGGVCLEEYPYPDRPPSHVLNGFLYALFGLLDLRESDGGNGEEMLDACVSSLRTNLEQYGLKYWSAYELVQGVPNPATRDYHDLHIAQLTVLHHLTGESVFGETAEAWRAYRMKPSNRAKALFGKLKHRILNPAPR